MSPASTESSEEPHWSGLSEPTSLSGQWRSGAAERDAGAYHSLSGLPTQQGEEPALGLLYGQL